LAGGRFPRGLEQRPPLDAAAVSLRPHLAAPVVSQPQRSNPGDQRDGEGCPLPAAHRRRRILLAVALRPPNEFGRGRHVYVAASTPARARRRRCPPPPR